MLIVVVYPQVYATPLGQVTENESNKEWQLKCQKLDWQTWPTLDEENSERSIVPMMDKSSCLAEAPD